MQSDDRIFLSTAPATPLQHRLALAMVAISLCVFVAGVPHAKEQLPALPAFIPLVASALVINDIITAILLIGQFTMLRSAALLVLAGGYLFTAAMTIAHALTFPGLFAPTGLLGAGPQSTAWLYIFWHAGFPCFVTAYALARRYHPGHLGGGRRPVAIWVVGGVLAVLVLAVGLAYCATSLGDWLPPLMEGNRIGPTGESLFMWMWLLSLVALAAIAVRRPYSVIDVWLMVTLCAWILDIAMSTVFNGGRFDFGFYAGRVYGLLASVFILGVLLMENGRLYARLHDAFETERRQRGELERTSAELRATNKQLEAFTYSISHDLRAPLSVMDGYAVLIGEEYGSRLDDGGRQLLAVLRDQTKRMRKLIENLLAFARTGGQRVAVAPVDMDDLVREVVQECQASHPAAKIGMGALPPAEGDRALLKQVWTNLINNALKYSSKRAAPRVQIGAEVRDNSLEYWVSDNGVGFDPRRSDKLFGVFQRLHSDSEFPGTGVGLAIVQQIVTRHGGSVGADSTPGLGARFHFVLPRHEPTRVGQ